MKINDEAVRYLLIQAQPTRVGNLVHQSPGKSPRNKHVKLVANMLFYYIYSDGQRQDVGFYVLENVQCSLVGVPGQPSRTFSMIFEGESGKKHYFSASTSEECMSWLTDLKRASYQMVKDELLTLRVKVMSLTGSDPLVALQDDMLARIMEGSSGGQSKLSRKGLAKPKSKYTSKFYTAQGPQVESTLKREKPTGPKSKFFTNLHVVRASDPSFEQSHGLSSGASVQPSRTVSSGIETLRRQALSAPCEVPSEKLIDI